MPIPKPRENEEQDNFMTRCMGDDVMKKEFPQNKQRVAVCMSSWRDKNKSKAESHDILEDDAFIKAFIARHPEYFKEVE
jgi:hypothetical protein